MERHTTGTDPSRIELLWSKYHLAAKELPKFHGISSELGRRRGIEQLYYEASLRLIKAGELSPLKAKYKM